MLAVVTTALLPAVSCSEVHAATNRAHASRSRDARHHRRRAEEHRAYEAIVGGHFARTGQFPWLARVLAHRGRVVDSCSGTVVATDLILTAGHCVEDVQTGIAYGASEFEVRTA